MRDRPSPDSSPDAFRNAISQWQLAARTEVKRFSSLPSSMFDACDPMLEARLAESVDNMMQCLNSPEGLRAAREYAICEEEQADEESKRVEQIEDDDICSLPQQVTGALPELDVDHGLSAEYLGLLIDSCTTADATCQAAARVLLARDFDVDCEDLEQAAASLRPQLPDLLGEPNAGTDARSAERLAELCGAIAASIVRAAQDEGERA